jgi:hypothetical protein
MSIGQLGTSGEQFRDFLGGGQRDVGSGLQAVLSSYANPNGNLVRLEGRTQGQFQLTNSEYQSVFDADSQNSFAETWYSEYRAVLQLRAEALKKKLSRAYTKVLENSIYAPLRPDETWAPGANRDMNDIDADAPTTLFNDGTGTGAGTIDGAPVIDPPPPPDDTEYMHPNWFSGGGPMLSNGNAYDDIRRYLAATFLEDGGGGDYLFDDIDGDGKRFSYTENTPGDPNDGTYNTGGENGGAQYYNLWNVGGTGPGANTAYSLSTLNVVNGSSYTNAVYEDIARNMNVPPSTDTTNFVTASNAPGSTTSNTYFISIPPTQDSRNVYQYLPAFAQGTNGVFSAAQKTTAISNGLVDADFIALTPTTFVLKAGTTFFDPAGAVSQNMFVNGSYAANGSGVLSPPTQIMNPALVGYAAGSKAGQDLSNTPPPEAYKQGFTDSWLEARQLEKREAAVKAAYDAYNDIASTPAGAAMPYAELMDVVFSSLDTFDVDLNNIPGGAPTLPAGAVVSKNKINGAMPYGYYSPSIPGGSPHASQNAIYQVGGNNLGPNNTDGSIYKTIYTNLNSLVDPSSLDPGGSGSTAISGTTTPTAPVPSYASGTEYGVLGGPNDSHLFSPIPIGAAENPFGSGQPDINNPAGVANLNDTTKEVPGFINGVDDVSKLFVGRQWDYVPGYVPGSTQNTTAGVGAVRYEAETTSFHVHAGIGWYDADGSNIASAPVTMSPPIDGFGIQIAAAVVGVGRFDDVSNYLLGGPFFQVAGGADSLGLGPDIGGPVEYSFTSGIGIGGGVGGIYWGHTSAVGKVYRIERLMEHSGGGDDANPSNNATDDLTGKGGGAGFAFDLMKASLGGIGSLGGLDVNSSDPNNGMSIFPNVGIAGAHVDGNLPIPIPIPGGGLYWLNIPLTTYTSYSYDVVTDYMQQYLDAMKHEVLDSVSAYSYATSGGYAMDSYGMRGEYQFTEKPALESLEKMPAIFGVELTGMMDFALGLIGLKDYSINNYDLQPDGILGEIGEGEAFRHSFNASEQRELDTGAFFTTASFLSQFQLNNLDYTYWSSTNQNEEMANLDTLRMLSLTGRDLMKALSKAIFGLGGNLLPDGPAFAIVGTVMNFMLDGFEERVNEAVMWDLLMRDQSDKGGVIKKSVIPTIRSVVRKTSSLTSEGYDFIEDERKLFAYDSQEIRKVGILGKLRQFGSGSFEIPNQMINGVGNTRRYKPYLAGPDGRAGRQGFGTNSPGTITPGTYTSGRVHEITRHAGDDTYFDDNWDIRVGFWQDTGLGDVNEVYVRKNTVSYDNAVNNGIGSGYAGGPVVTTQIDRYVGSHNRIVGRGYDGATPLDLQSFRTGYFSEKYFGSYIDEINFTSPTSGGGDAPADAGDDAITYDILGGIDGDVNRDVKLTMHGGSKYYDRRYDYEFNLRSADTISEVDGSIISGTQINLQADQALAPVLGGAMKLMTVQSNDPNQTLGASTQNEDNPLTQVLYDHMRIRADGSNAQLVAEFRDVFNMGYLDDIFISAAADAATGGGVASSIRIKFGNKSWLDSASAPITANLGSYEQDKQNEVVGTGTLSTVPGYLGDRSYFKNVNRSIADIYLSSYFAFKRPPKTQAK